MNEAAEREPIRPTTETTGEFGEKPPRLPLVPRKSWSVSMVQNTLNQVSMAAVPDPDGTRGEKPAKVPVIPPQTTPAKRPQ